MYYDVVYEYMCNLLMFDVRENCMLCIFVNL